MNRSALFSVGGAAALAWGLGLAVGGLTLASPGAAAAQEADCSGLARSGLFTDTTVISARMVAADPAKGAPAFCEVTGVVRPLAGSNIGVVYRLPEGWNGKMLGLGGGGWAGNVRIEAAEPGLKAGYATAQTDGGHAGTGVWDTAWASNPESVKDFAWRAIHLMTDVGKQVVARYYGKPQSKAYYEGCSTGGRMGMMEVQRFPADYDAAIVGAPVYNLTVQTTAVVRTELFSAPGAGFTPELLTKVNQAVLSACDAKDGAVDGLLADPRSCGWDPAQMQCKPGASGGDCLNPAQVNALRSVYNGVRTIDGRVAAWPLERGGEAGWSFFVGVAGSDPTNGGGLGGLWGPILGDPNFVTTKFDPATDLARVRSSNFARSYEANDPDIRAFAQRGGKLIMWHGWSDPGPSPIATITYFDQVQGVLGSDQQTARLFLAPGVGHCGGGPGPDRVDWLDVLDRWVQTGAPPAEVLATKANAPISRPLCAYPAEAHYKGSGDLDDAKNFECRR
jgi:feruloyl esterase